MHGGEALRTVRERLGLTLRDVEAASLKLVEKYSNPEYLLTLSRVSDIETKGVLPSLFRLYSLAVIYRREVRDLMMLFGIEVGNQTIDSDMIPIPRTHKTERLGLAEQVRVPVKMDPGFNLRRTTSLSRMIAAWGTVPYALLEQFESDNYTYGYVGTEDFTMYPLLLPGSFVRLDGTKRRVAAGPWRAEYERPIYFVETREGFVCSWCDMDGERITLTPHPLSPMKSRTLRLDREADVLGQVVAFAMRLDEFSSAPLPQTTDSGKLGDGRA